MKIADTIRDLRREVAHKSLNRSLVLVPTMGNLHEGHISLIKTAQQQGDLTCVSLFVNPLQFGPTEDFDKYPRTLEQDLEKLSNAGVDIVFTPTIEELYPTSRETFTKVDYPILSSDLCGITRKQFFSGIMVVISKLFNIVQPNFAVFGEKDYQQLTIIKNLVQDLNFPITIISSPTIREQDGLAMSSRNGYLTAMERKMAPLLYQTLCKTKEHMNKGNRDFGALEMSACESLNQGGFRTDYVAIRRKQDLALPTVEDDAFIILTAAYLGKTRLIDNIFV